MITKGTFRPHLFISVGETEALFTLRETYLHEIWSRSEDGSPVCTLEVRSMHHFNLSQDKNEAMQKAIKYSQNSGLRLTTKIEDLNKEMRDISRRSPEEIESALQNQRQLNAKHNAELSAKRDAQIMSRLTLKGGINKVGFGKYETAAFEDAVLLDEQYFQWLLKNNKEAEERGDVYFNNDTQNAFIEFYLDKFKGERVESEYFGEVGTRYAFEATVQKVSGFDTQFGWTSVYTLITEAGEVIVLFTSASMGQTGERLSFNAKVKEHSLYQDVKQTVLQRPTKISLID